MVLNCAALDCKNRFDKRPAGVTFHRFPKNDDLRLLWEKGTCRQNWKATRNHALCSMHFEERCFDRTGQTVRLRDNSIPSIFSTIPKSSKIIKKPQKLPAKESAEKCIQKETEEEEISSNTTISMNTKRYCCAKNCFNCRETPNGMSFFYFPRDEVRCKEWLKRAGRSDLLDKSAVQVYGGRYLLCGAHFQDNQFYNSKIRNRLMRTAMPTIFPTEPNVKKCLKVSNGATVDETSEESNLVSDTRNISPSPAPEEMSFQVFTISHEYQEPSDSNTVEVTILPDMSPGSDESENDPLLGSCLNNTHQSPRDLCKDSLLKLVPCGWGTQYVGKELLFTRIHNEVVLMSLRVDCDFRLCLKVCGEELNEDHPLYAPLSNHRISTVHDLISVLVMLNRWRTCLGVRENELINVFLSVTLVKVKDCKVKWHSMSLHSFACQQIVSTSESKTLCIECKKLESRLSSKLKYRNKKCLNSISTNDGEEYNNS